MKLFLSVILVILISFACTSRPGDTVFAQKNIPVSTENNKSYKADKNKSISNDTNIHFDTSYCLECHTAYPENSVIGKQNLKFKGDYKLLCKCHYEGALKELHPVDITPSQEMKTHIPTQFPLSAGKITCSTCHDIAIQCQDISKIYPGQENFLIGGPYKNISDQCFKCHDSNNFKRYNPHKQLNKNGDIIKETCLYCHPEIPEIKNRNNVKEVKLIGNYTELCKGCHMKTNPTSLHDKHVRRPSAGVLTRIKVTEKKLNIKLPMTEDGMVTCVTCHNPHEKNLIPGYRSGIIDAAQTQDTPTGFSDAVDAEQDTSTGFSGTVCTMCHEMQ